MLIFIKMFLLGALRRFLVNKPANDLEGAAFTAVRQMAINFGKGTA